MGQQQLLLLVLGIVIVGLAVVAGINAFDENQQKSSEDALTNEAFRIASDAKAWYNKPEQYDGGGSKSSSLDEITWADIGVSDASLTDGTSSDASGNYETPWGQVKMTQGSPLKFELQTNQSDSKFGKVEFDPSNGSGDQINFSSQPDATTDISESSSDDSGGSGSE